MNKNYLIRLLFLRGDSMEIKKDSKGRNLKPGEDQMKDGRYRYRYIDKYGNRKPIYAWKLVPTDKTPKGKREDLSLREKVKKIQKDIEDGIKLYDAKITVTEMVERYLSTKVSLAVTTKNNYINMMNRNIKNTRFGNMQIEKVNKSDVKKYYAYLFTEKKFKVGTLQLYQNLIFPSFQMAVDDDIIRKNPCVGCMKDYLKNSLYNSKTPLTKEEQNELLKFLKEDNIFGCYYVLVAFMLSTGCRISEAIGITWDDINLKEKYISVNHQLIYKKKDKNNIQYFIAPTKTKETRIIPLQDEIVSILQKYKEQTYFISMSNNFEVDGRKGFIFYNRNMKPHQPNTIVKAFHLLVASHNKNIDDGEIVLPDFTPHTLRHTFCTRMAENGMDIRILQEIMGHKTLEVTMQVYNHVSTNRTKKEVERVPSVLEVI